MEQNQCQNLKLFFRISVNSFLHGRGVFSHGLG